MLPLKSNSIKEKGRTFQLHTVELENAIFGFFCEEKMKIGTLAIATPKTSEALGSSSIILGYKNATIARLLAEYLANNFNKIALTSVFIYSENDIPTNKILLKLAQTTLGATVEENR